MPTRVVRWCLPVAMLLGLLGVPGGFMLDDWYFVAASRLPIDQQFRFDFSFASGDPEITRRFMDLGVYFWWTLPELKLAFFRPLASALIHIDLLLFGQSPLGHHVHSALWYVAAAAGARAVYRRILPWERSGGVAVGALALVLFTLDPNHVLPVIWLSNRNAVVASAFALAAFALHLRVRGQADRTSLTPDRPLPRWAPLGVPLLMAAGLSAGEVALCFLPYFLCFELFAAPGRLRERLVTLAPLGALVLAYLALRAGLGLGVYGSGIYLDPFNAPLAFLEAAPPRFLALLAGRLLWIAADLWLLAPELRPIQVGGGVVAVVVWGLLYRKVWGELSDDERGVVRWAAPATVLSLIPVLGTFPSGRLLMPATLGSAALLGVLATVGWRRGCPEKKGLAVWCRVVGILFWAGTILAPGIWAFTAAVTIQRDQHLVAASLAAPLTSTGLDGAPVVMIGGGREGMLPFYIRWIRTAHGAPQPLRWWTLSSAPWPHRLTRIDDRTLEIEPQGGELLGTIFETLVRDAEHPFSAGDRVELDGLSVEVRSVVDGRPKIVRFTFDRSADELQILVPRDPSAGEVILVGAPAVGQSRIVGE